MTCRLVVAAAVLALAATSAHAKRAKTDRRDDAPGRAQVHAIYAVPSDGGDRHLDTNGTLVASIESWTRWTRGQTGGRSLRIDRFHRRVDITFVRLRQTDDQLADEGLYIRDAIERELKKRGFRAKHKIYAVYYDGTARETCGGGAWPPALPGIVGALYLRGTFADPSVPPCSSNPFAATAKSKPGYKEFSMLHELLHTLGFVPTCAPHHTRGGHTSDSPRDLMYAGDEPWAPSVLDVGHDDYFKTGRGSECPDLANSPFLTPAG
jgi:hypothetical protein